MRITKYLVALLVAGTLAPGCRDNQISAEHPGSRGPSTSLPAASATQVAAAPATVAIPAPPPPAPAGSAQASVDLSNARAAFATPNAATGGIEIVIPDRPTSCGPLQAFPKTCEKAWRVRIELAPEYQRPGRYPLGPELLPWSYRDAQDRNTGAWGAGKHCKNLGDHFSGSLEIVAVDADGITGVLSGAGEADGPFRAQRCPSCNGTGLPCTNNSECCNDFCHAGRCQP